MPELKHPAYSYRTDPDVPKFDDSKALFVFDGICVLCSGGAAWIMRHDRNAKVNFSSAQSPLGQALYRHYGTNIDESYLFIAEGRAFTASAGYLSLCTTLGGWWRLLRLAHRWPPNLFALASAIATLSIQRIWTGPILAVTNLVLILSARTKHWNWQQNFSRRFRILRLKAMR